MAIINSIQHSLEKITNSFKTAGNNLTHNKLILVLICVSLILIVIFTIKNGSIDLFDTSTSSPTAPFAPEDPSDLLPIPLVIPTNAFTNFNLDFIKSYTNSKNQNNNYINQLQTQTQTINNLNSRISDIINE